MKESKLIKLRGQQGPVRQFKVLQQFEGKVTELAPSLGIPRMGSRGARRATDVEVMEVMIDLEGSVPLLPGMRADAFFR